MVEIPATNSILHTHSMYSMFDSTQTPDEMVARAKELGCENITLTDHGTLLGVEPFMDAGIKYGVNTIPGVEAYLEHRRHLLLIAKDYEGYQQISFAMRDANLHIEKVGKHMTFPIMDNWILEKYFKGNTHVIATTACIQGLPGHTLLLNHQIKQKMQKKQQELDTKRESYECYRAVEKQIRSITDKVKSLEKEKTSYKKYLSPAYENKIVKLKKAIRSAEKELEDMLPDEGIRAEAKKKHQKAIQEYELAMNSRELANHQVPLIDKEINQLKEEKKQWEKQKKQYSSGRNRYMKILDELNEMHLIPEEELHQKAREQLGYLKSIFPNLFVELQYHGMEQEAYVMPLLVKLADELQIPVIAGNDAHMSDGSENSIEARRIIRFNYFEMSQTVSEADRTLYLKSNEELFEALSQPVGPETALTAIRNTEVLNQCKVVLPTDPHYPVVKDGPSFDELLEEARQKRIAAGTWNEIYEARLRHEIQVIKSMGYVDYHMVVRDFCFMGRKLGVIPKKELKNLPEDFSKLDEWLATKNFRTGIGIGPGRGSAAGSLVCFLLGITNIDPIKYNLLFERFLNPERVSLPDIDTDVATRLRPCIIRYLKWKYGEKAVCSIATENTYGAKGAIQMAGRERSAQLYGKSKEYEAEKKKYYGMTIKISDMVPEKPGIQLSQVEADIRAEFGSNPEAMLVLDRAKLLEGRLYGTSVHAGGVVISDNDNVNEYIPLAWNDAIQVWAAQCNMVRLEERGMLKMDLLGLNTLDVISDCVQMVEKYHGIVIDLDHIPFEKEVFREIYAKGLTNSVFQFESPGMKSMLVDFKPDCFEDLILLVAAYRPGPMQYLKDIIEVKNGRKKADYLVPQLKPILSATYSAIIYQEQVMQIFQELAGYSLGKADLVRRAMSKKKTKVLEKERESFVHGDPSRGIKGCAANGISEKTAHTLFDQVMDFAKYCFNKSHAAAYALVSYQTAWLKYHYPAEFLCAMFNNKEMDKYEPIYSDCREFGIRILPPDVNYSYFDFILEGKAIRYGLKGVKGIGGANEATINDFVEKRTLDFYLSFPDFLSRNLQVEEKKVSVLSGKLMETMIKVGVFDSFCKNRKHLLEKLQSINSIEGENAEYVMKEMLNRIEIEPLPADQSVNWENETELLGAILSEDPLSDYGDDSQYGCIPISQMTEGESVRIFGLVTKVEQKKSSKGRPMILLRILGKNGTCLVYLMNRLYTRYESENLQNQILYVNGVSGGNGRVFADEIGRQSKATGLYELILDSKEDTALAKEIFAKDSGGPVSIRILFYYLKDETGYQKSKIPKVYQKPVQESTIQELRKSGLHIREYSSKIV